MGEAKFIKICEEFVETERSYVDGLETLIAAFYDPLVAQVGEGKSVVCPSFLPEHIPVVFGNIVQIRDVHKQFLQKVTPTSEGAVSGEALTEAFLSVVSDLGAYIVYCVGFDESQEVQRKLSNENSDIQLFFQGRPPVQSLSSYLIMPVQRIPRYRLLLTELLKCCPSHLNPQLQVALKEVSTLALQINDEIRERQSQNEIAALSLQFSEDPKLAKRGRILIKREDLSKRCRSGLKVFHFMLFNDLLVYASVLPLSTTKYRLHRKIPIDGSFELSRTLEQSGGSSSKSRLAPRRKGGVDRVEVETLSLLNPQKSFVIEFATSEKRIEWRDAFTQCIAKARAPRCSVSMAVAPAAVLKPKSAVQFCGLCKCKFSVFKPAKHCRMCGNLFCSNCTRSRVPLFRLKRGADEEDSQKGKRVCNVCATSMADQRTKSTVASNLAQRSVTPSLPPKPAGLKNQKSQSAPPVLVSVLDTPTKPHPPFPKFSICITPPSEVDNGICNDAVTPSTTDVESNSLFASPEVLPDTELVQPGDSKPTTFPTNLKKTQPVEPPASKAPLANKAVMKSLKTEFDTAVDMKHVANGSSQGKSVRKTVAALEQAVRGKAPSVAPIQVPRARPPPPIRQPVTNVPNNVVGPVALSNPKKVPLQPTRPPPPLPSAQGAPRMPLEPACKPPLRPPLPGETTQKAGRAPPPLPKRIPPPPPSRVSKTAVECKGTISRDADLSVDQPPRSNSSSQILAKPEKPVKQMAETKVPLKALTLDKVPGKLQIRPELRLPQYQATTQSHKIGLVSPRPLPQSSVKFGTMPRPTSTAPQTTTQPKLSARSGTLPRSLSHSFPRSSDRTTRANSKSLSRVPPQKLSRDVSQLKSKSPNLLKKSLSPTVSRLHMNSALCKPAQNLRGSLTKSQTLPRSPSALSSLSAQSPLISRSPVVPNQSPLLSARSPLVSALLEAINCSTNNLLPSRSPLMLVSATHGSPFAPSQLAIPVRSPLLSSPTGFRIHAVDSPSVPRLRSVAASPLPSAKVERKLPGSENRAPPLNLKPPHPPAVAGKFVAQRVVGFSAPSNVHKSIPRSKFGPIR